MARYGFLDAIRGLAACSVMLQHSLYASGILGNFNSGQPLIGFIPTWLELGETGVVAFFLVSGFVIPLSLEKTADLRLFWRHRAFRIYPLYIAVYIAFFAITGWQGYPFDLDVRYQCAVAYIFPSGISEARKLCPQRLDALTGNGLVHSDIVCLRAFAY